MTQVILHNKKKLSRHYKGEICKSCGIPVTFNCKSGYCRKHTNKATWNEDRKTQYSLKQKGEGSPAWKGDFVSVAGVHRWICGNWGRASGYFCKCGKQAHDWANLNDIYNRDRNNWETMCRSCHQKYDYNRGNR